MTEKLNPFGIFRNVLLYAVDYKIKYIKTIRNQSEETHMIKFLVLSQNF